MQVDAMTAVRRQILTWAMVIALPAALHAQSAGSQPADAQPAGAAAPNSWFTRVSLSPSHVVADSPFESGGDGAQALSIEMGRQTAGGAEWHRVYNYPAYGVGFSTARFDHRRELGQPIALYGFFSWPFPIAARLQLSADVGLGVSWHWNAYDAATNPTNTALGSSAAYHVIPKPANGSAPSIIRRPRSHHSRSRTLRSSPAVELARIRPCGLARVVGSRALQR